MFNLSRNNMPKPDEIQRNSKGRESKRFTSVGTLVLCADVNQSNYSFLNSDTASGIASSSDSTSAQA